MNYGRRLIPESTDSFLTTEDAESTEVERTLLPKYRMDRFLNADDIARGLSPMNTTAAALKAGRLLLEEAKNLIGSQTSFALESTLSGKGHARLIRQASAAGYRIILHCVMVESVELAIERVGLRVKLGGHHVPDSDVDRRFYRSRKLLAELYLPLVDKWSVWDNSAPSARAIANHEQNSVGEVGGILKAAALEETAGEPLPDIVRKGLEASREATEEMLEYYRRMGVKVTPQMTLAEGNEDLWIPRGAL